MDSRFEVVIFYKYTPVTNAAGCVAWIKRIGAEIGISGRFLIANEGINGTFEGTSEQVKTFIDAMRTQNGATGKYADFSDIWFKASPGNGKAFAGLKVKLRKEIVATGLDAQADIDPNQVTGTHIEPEELKRWFEQGEQFEIIDMRNEYEYAVGHFAGSKNSRMENFRDLTKITPAFEELKKKKVLTVCTYGVRCEKASGYLKQQGFENVYQLHGGIGTYMKKFPGQEFKGSLYVFDSRMTEHFDGEAHEVIGTCYSCHTKTERFGNCAYFECHKQLLICDTCAKGDVYCKESCRDAVVQKSAA